MYYPTHMLARLEREFHILADGGLTVSAKLRRLLAVGQIITHKV